MDEDMSSFFDISFRFCQIAIIVVSTPNLYFVQYVKVEFNIAIE